MKYQYNGQQIDLPKSVTHYVKAVERHLSLPKKIRRRVLSDLLTGMCARNENGESYQEILASMGTPTQVAQGINEEMADFAYRKSPWRFLFLGLSIVCCFLLLYYFMIGDTLGAIGGADGPTVIFVTSSFPAFFQFQILSVIVLLIVGILGFLLLRHLKPKR